MISGTIEIVRGSDTLDLSDLTHYAVLETDGFGMAPLHRITERGPLQHGVSDRGYRLDPRLIQMVINLRATDWAGQYSRRQELLDFLSPTDVISLRHTQPDGTVRQIDCYCTDGPLFATKDRLGHQFQRAAVRLHCPDPAWYDPDRQSVYIAGSAGGTGFAFPMAVPWTLGGSSVDATLALDYTGTWIEYPEIVILGAIADPKIEHLDTGDVLDFDGLTLAAGDYYTIDLRYGYKTVTNQAGVNKISDLTAESDLATWALNPGINNLRFSGATADENSAIILRYYLRYLGV